MILQTFFEIFYKCNLYFQKFSFFENFSQKRVDNFLYTWYNNKALGNAPVAQLDRVTGYEPVGRGFESLLAHQSKRVYFGKPVFLFPVEIKQQALNFTLLNIRGTAPLRRCWFFVILCLLLLL